MAALRTAHLVGDGEHDMGWISKRPRTVATLISPNALADFGRTQVLRGNVAEAWAGLSVFALDYVRPLFDSLYGGPPTRDPLPELRQHASNGGWTAVGAWQFCIEFVDDRRDEWSDLEELGIRTLSGMGLANASVTLGMSQLERWSEILGQRPPYNGFFGPPTFTTEAGPSLDFYRDHARRWAANRRPQRIPPLAGRPPHNDAGSRGEGMWDFARLVLCGPLVVGEHNSDEASMLRDAGDAAYLADHVQIAAQLLEAAREDAARGAAWVALGAARFCEEYLDDALTGSPIHRELLTIGHEWLRTDHGSSARLTATYLFTPVEAATWKKANR